MLDIEEIEKEISRLENCQNTTHDICEKLANLYIVKEYFTDKNMKNNASMPAMSMGLK